MTITLKELKKAGLEPDFIRMVRRYIPKTVDDSEARRYVKAVLQVAADRGLVGADMMRQMAHMKVNRALLPGLYSEIINYKKRAQAILSGEKVKDDDLPDTPKAAKAAKKAKAKKEADDAGDASGAASEEAEEEEEVADDEVEASEEEGAEAEAGEEAGDVYDFEGFEYRSAPHPRPSKALLKFGDDGLWPVPPERLWRYKTARYKTFAILTGDPRTRDQHRKKCSRKGVTKPQFDAAWKAWEKEGKKTGWMLVEVEKGKHQLQPQEPIG